MSHPSHVLLIFSSEPSSNSRPSIIMFLKCQLREDKLFFKYLATLGQTIPHLISMFIETPCIDARWRLDLSV